MRRALGGALFVLAFVGCGGDGGTSPNEPFPDASGSYATEGGFDGLTRQEASFQGSVSIEQASRMTGTLTGTTSITLNVEGDITTVSDVPLVSASVTPGGVVSFRIGSSAQGLTWTFSGTLSGDVLTGRHSLTISGGTISGDWTATRP